MSINHQAQAILLLTARLGRPDKDAPRPLGPVEWGRFAQWLRDRGMVPDMLLCEDPAAILAEWTDRTITLERIRYLMGRAAALGLAMERWERAGLWVMTRSDSDYPARLKKRLKADSPPFFFGCGDRSILNQGGIAVTGSREACEEDLAFTARLGARAALEGLAVISGGARGVDETTMLGALELDGRVVGVLADSLLRAATSARYRKGLMAGNLALISPFNPEAGFDVGSAMARNRYIYCLADAAVVIVASPGKGGTWSGAVENLRHRWVPLWVKATQSSGTGNAALVDRGARWLPDIGAPLRSLLASASEVDGESHCRESGEQRGLFEVELPPAEESSVESTAVSLVSNGPTGYQAEEETGHTPLGRSEIPRDLDSYTLFLVRLEQLTAERPATLEQLLQAMEIHRGQLGEWLNRAMHEGRVKKLSKPVRYIWASGPAKQPHLFDPSGG